MLSESVPPPILFLRKKRIGTASDLFCPGSQLKQVPDSIKCCRDVSIYALDEKLKGHLKKRRSNSPGMNWHQGTTIQLSGLIVSLFGWVSSCVVTYVPLWKSLNLELNDLEIWNMGLWQTCVSQAVMQCENYASLLALPLEIKISRVLMVTSNGLGFLAFSLALLGSDCLKTSDPRQKRHLGVAGGLLFCLSGMTTLVPISWVAYDTVRDFWDPTLPDVVPRWEFGEALFLGWFAAFFLLLGGCLVIGATCFLTTPKAPKRPAIHHKAETATLAIQHPPPPPKNADLVI